MIPEKYIKQWRQFAPWTDDLHVEQDLILSRIIIEIFSDPLLKEELAFRGGTALHKLFFKPAARYSEDIDLVRVNTGSIKHIILALHSRLDHWLGKPRTQQSNASFKMRYHFSPEGEPNLKRNIKIEINTRECFSYYDRIQEHFSVASDWFSDEAFVNTFQLEELIATKLRALYQRKKGRDLFDLWLASQQKNFNIEKAISAFEHYMKKEGNIITRSDFEKNLADKLQDSAFTTDMNLLLSPKLNKSQTENNSYSIAGNWNLYEAAEKVKNKIIELLP